MSTSAIVIISMYWMLTAIIILQNYLYHNRQKRHEDTILEILKINKASSLSELALTQKEPKPQTGKNSIQQAILQGYREQIEGD